MKRYFYKTAVGHWISAFSLAVLGAVLFGCSTDAAEQDNGGSETQWMLSASADDTSVTKALGSKLAVRINLQTNRATLYKSGTAIDQWNIASADVSGEFHDNIPQSTPTGIFKVEDMQVCPTWLPRAPKDPKTGKIAANEQERLAIFKANPDLFGPCGSKNPLGQYVIWFHGEYGIHGNAAEWILEIADAEQRRVSGGCIRNPNSKIKEVFHDVIDSFPSLSSFRTATLAMESASAKDKKTLTQSLEGVDMKVVVGRWSNDPEKGSTSNTAGAGEPKQPSAPIVIPKKLKCTVSAVDPVLGVATTYDRLPANHDSSYSFYSKGDEALVLEELVGTNYVRTIRGLISKNMLSNCQIQR